jgi:TolA-binding protein
MHVESWPKPRVIASLLGIWLIAQISGTSYASQTDASGIAVYQFGLHLFRLGDYYRAITELKRFSLLFPQNPHMPAAQVLIGLALQADGEPDAALTHFQRLSQTQEPTEVNRLALFKLGELHLAQQRPADSASAYP